jgi:hypothetical protein
MIRTLFLSVLLFVFIGYHFFQKIHVVEVKKVLTIPIKSSFYPYAYTIFNSEEQFRNFLNFTQETKQYGKFISERSNYKFDFSKNRYCIVYGRELKYLYWSYKSTLLEDPTPSWEKDYRIPLFTLYKKRNLKNQFVFIYALEKNDCFRGVFYE